MSLEDLAGYDGDDRRIRQLIEQASQVAALQDHPGWQVLTDYILSRAHKFEEAMVVGTHKSYEEYRETVGWLKGATYFRHALAGMEQTIRREIENAAPSSDQEAVYPDDGLGL